MINDYTINNGLKFGNDRVEGLKEGKAIIPFRGCYCYGEMVGTIHCILEGRYQSIVFEFDVLPGHYFELYCNGAEGNFKLGYGMEDWEEDYSTEELKKVEKYIDVLENAETLTEEQIEILESNMASKENDGWDEN